MSKRTYTYECDRCHRQKPGRPVLELTTYGVVRPTNVWDLCHDCLLDLVAWIEGTNDG